MDHATLKAIAYCDGSGNSPKGSTCACVVFDSQTGHVLSEKSKSLVLCSNNIAEYEGLILALETAKDLGVTDLQVFSDSQLIVNQIHENWKVKEVSLLTLRSTAWAIGMTFDSLTLTWVPRENNKRADSLCRSELKNWKAPAVSPDLSPSSNSFIRIARTDRS